VQGTGVWYSTRTRVKSLFIQLVRFQCIMPPVPGEPPTQPRRRLLGERNIQVPEKSAGRLGTRHLVWPPIRRTAGNIERQPHRVRLPELVLVKFHATASLFVQERVENPNRSHKKMASQPALAISLPFRPDTGVYEFQVTTLQPLTCWPAEMARKSRIAPQHPPETNAPSDGAYHCRKAVTQVQANQVKQLITAPNPPTMTAPTSMNFHRGREPLTLPRSG
jgi:hypothetical protein